MGVEQTPPLILGNASFIPPQGYQTIPQTRNGAHANNRPVRNRGTWRKESKFAFWPYYHGPQKVYMRSKSWVCSAKQMISGSQPHPQISPILTQQSYPEGNTVAAVFYLMWPPPVLFLTSGKNSSTFFNQLPHPLWDSFCIVSGWSWAHRDPTASVPKFWD